IRDVYVFGESSPRLLGSVLRQGLYFDKATGDTIYRATQIKGDVIDGEGKTLLTLSDIEKGLVDETGKPFKTIMQMAAA
ncbi:hypothetical protein ACXWOS_10920, partial [Streptococcus pyogenes]